MGSGPPLVVVNGFAATKDDWDPIFLAALAESRELVLLDNRGMGESPDDGLPFTVGDLAADVAGVIDALGLARPGVLGWSMGGFVAQNLAATRPELLGSLVLLSTRPAGDASAPATPDVRDRLLDFSGTPREQASRLISLLFLPDRAREIDEQFGDIVAEARAALPPDTVDEQKEILARWGGREGQLGDIRCPTLVAAGTDDVVVPPANSLALTAGIDGAWLARFPRSGHGFMADHPERLAALITTFLGVDAP